MKIVNLTPHAINVVISGTTVRSFEPSGEIARAEVSYDPAGEVEGLPIYTTETGNITGLPEAEEGVGYIVSALVRSAFPNRIDLYSPGELVRNEAGQPIGCRGLVRNP